MLGILWVSREHLRQVLRKGVAGATDIRDDDEIMSYRGAVVGLVVGIGAMLFWLLQVGVPLWGALVFLFFAFVIYISPDAGRGRRWRSSDLHPVGGSGCDYFRHRDRSPRGQGPSRHGIRAQLRQQPAEFRHAARGQRAQAQRPHPGEQALGCSGA